MMNFQMLDLKKYGSFICEVSKSQILRFTCYAISILSAIVLFVPVDFLTRLHLDIFKNQCSEFLLVLIFYGSLIVAISCFSTDFYKNKKLNEYLDNLSNGSKLILYKLFKGEKCVLSIYDLWFTELDCVVTKPFNSIPAVCPKTICVLTDMNVKKWVIKHKKELSEIKEPEIEEILRKNYDELLNFSTFIEKINTK